MLLFMLNIECHSPQLISPVHNKIERILCVFVPLPTGNQVSPLHGAAYVPQQIRIETCFSYSKLDAPGDRRSAQRYVS